MINIVFDIDDTISIHKDRDYKNAEPITEVIEKINYLHDELNYYITLYTARGMISCNGNLENIIKKNKEILVNWLKKHNVHYDELRFGKPIADMYVDDKCMNVSEFLGQEFCELRGGSGKSVHRIGNVVKKRADEKKIKRTIKFNEKSENICCTPKIISTTYNDMYMNYIEGDNLSLMKDPERLELAITNIINIIKRFRTYRTPGSSFNLDKHIEVIDKNRGYNSYIDSCICKCEKLLCAHESELIYGSSLCHGDLTLSNVIVDSADNLWLIDPEYDEQASSYLLDYAKLRMSLSGYERLFKLSDIYPLNVEKNEFDLYLKREGIYRLVVVLNYMYVIRLWRYKSEEDKPKVIKMLVDLEAENDNIF